MESSLPRRMFLISTLAQRDLLDALGREIEKQSNDTVKVRPWHRDVFQVGDSILERLEQEIGESDFALVLFTGDDRVDAKGVEQLQPRDNVLFELGLATATLGRSRTFLVYDQATSPRVLSDCKGIVYISLSSPNVPEHSTSTAPAALQERARVPARQVVEHVNGLGPRLFKRLGALARSVGAVGYPEFVDISRDVETSVDHIVRELPKRLAGNLPSAPNFLRRLRDAATGVYEVVSPAEVYRHDSEALLGLKKGERYFATHPAAANTFEHSDDSTAYRQYVAAQISAAQNGVDVRRVYLLAGDHDLHPVASSSIQALKDAGVKIKTVMQGHVAKPPRVSTDFVLIGSNCLGMGLPESGEMDGSRYYLYPSESALDRSIIDAHSSYFNELWSDASRVDILGSRKQRSAALDPAVVEMMPVNVRGALHQRLMIVLRTGGCAYDKNKQGCTMCDFQYHRFKEGRVTSTELATQLHRALDRNLEADDIGQVDLLTLGSFLHDDEVPREFGPRAMDVLAAKPSVRRIVIESRASYVSQERLLRLRHRLRPDQILELGLGVETSDERLRNGVLRKALSNEQVFRVMADCRDSGTEFMAYLLIGTQSLSADQSVSDAVASAHWIAARCRERGVPFRISFEPVFITNDTVLERAFKEGSYRLVSLWQVVDVILRTHMLGPIFIGLSDEGLSDKNGTKRVPGGCDACDGLLRDAIDRFNGSQSVDQLRGLSCEFCRP